jgi:SAM-dependent methyltransferase
MPAAAGLSLLEWVSRRPVCVADGGQYQEMGRYAFARSWDREDERLGALECQLDPVSQAAIGQLGLVAGWRCWEAGAGRGSMAAWLADQVAGSGSALVTDIDMGGLSGLHQANLTVARHDLEREDAPSDEFDLIHARLVLEHLREPAAVVSKLASALRAGGWLVLEDADGLRFDAEPAHQAFAAITGPWQRAARAAGWNPCYGRHLVADLQRAGLGRVGGRAHRHYQPGGGAWLVARLGIERMRDHIRRAGASPADLDDALAALDDPTRMIIGAPTVTAWGQRTG